MDEHHPNGHPLIEQYLAGLQRSLAARPDSQEVVAELRDHLLAATERHERDGKTPVEAERAAIRDVGEPELVARAFVENRRGVPAVPTPFTRLAALGGYVAAAGAVIATFGSAMSERADDADGWTGPAMAWYAVGSVGVLLLTVGLLVLLIGTVCRHGGLGAAGWFAVGVGALGAMVSIIAWAVAVWAGLVAVSWLVVLAATRHAGVAPRDPMAFLVTGLGALPLLIIAADELAQSGRGGTALAAVAGTALVLASVVLVVSGAIRLARWLEAEVPVAPEAPEMLAT